MDETMAGAPTASAPPQMPAVPGFTHRYIETPGLRTHVATIGAGDPVVCCTAFRSTGGSGARSGRASPSGIR
jgi:hypothetical protein